MIVDHPVLRAIEEHIVKSLPEYSVIGGLFLVAAAVAMIPPDKIRAWLMSTEPFWYKFKEGIALLYEWFYDTIQGFLAARGQKKFTQLVETPNTTVITQKEDTKSNG